MTLDVDDISFAASKFGVFEEKPLYCGDDGKAKPWRGRGGVRSFEPHRAATLMQKDMLNTRISQPYIITDLPSRN